MLPNPFNSTNSSHLNSRACGAAQTSTNSPVLNPGPGLPQAFPTSYSNYVPRPQKSFSHRGGGFSSGWSSGSQYLPFSCDRCDRSFKSQELLDHHISEHIQCGIDGCPFVAHPKIVEKHIQMQHETGLAEKIMRLNTPEEIEKWREERRKKFPTKDNVARRQAEQKEKLDRGELLYEPKNRFGRGNQRGRGRGGRGQGRNHRLLGASGASETKKTDYASYLPKQAPTPTVQLQAVKEKPITSVKTETKKELSDGEIDSADDEKETPSSSSNALTSLLSCYASDSDAEEGDKAVKKIKAEPPIEPISKEQDSQEGKELFKKKNKKRERKHKDKRQANPPKHKIRARRLTLLQKLLQGEIIHERNVVLQCVHYIVQQNFFGVGQVSQQDPQSLNLNVTNSIAEVLQQ